MMKIREQAVETLLRILNEGAYSNLETKKILSQHTYCEEDRRLYLNIVYGTIQNLYYLDHQLSRFVNRKLTQLDASVLMNLRTALYQIIFLDKVPDYAAVNEAVNMTGKKARGFVNGVLRNILRNREKLTEWREEDFKNEKEMLSIRYSLPVWVVHKYYECFGNEKAERIIPMLNEKPPFTVRVNTLKINRESLIREFEALGIEAVPGELDPDALHLKQIGVFEGEVQSSALFKEGCFTIQDQGAMLTARLLDPEPGERILDFCSAPGGKTTHLAQLMDDRGEIIARDIFDSRLELVQKTAERLGIHVIRTENVDGTVLRKEDVETFDRILLDAPCSGLGIVRRKPEIRYGMDKKARKALIQIQSEMLDRAADYLKPGGILVYSTCTVNPDENEHQIRRFLERHPEMVSASDLGDRSVHYTCPLRDGADGFFMCRLEKKQN